VHWLQDGDRMALQSIECPPIDCLNHVNVVQVTLSTQGGWDITVTNDERVLASRHCDDWHCTERAIRAFEDAFSIRPH
jgi:hypothetical protein